MNQLFIDLFITIYASIDNLIFADLFNRISIYYQYLTAAIITTYHIYAHHWRIFIRDNNFGYIQNGRYGELEQTAARGVARPEREREVPYCAIRGPYHWPAVSGPFIGLRVVVAPPTVAAPNQWGAEKRPLPQRRWAAAESLASVRPSLSCATDLLLGSTAQIFFNN